MSINKLVFEIDFGPSMTRLMLETIDHGGVDDFSILLQLDRPLYRIKDSINHMII
jgi:hypothetical protein